MGVGVVVVEDTGRALDTGEVDCLQQCGLQEELLLEPGNLCGRSSVHMLLYCLFPHKILVSSTESEPSSRNHSVLYLNELSW